MKFERTVLLTAAFVVGIMILMAAWTTTLISIDKHYEDRPSISEMKAQEAIQSSIEVQEAVYAYLEEIEAE